MLDPSLVASQPDLVRANLSRRSGASEHLAILDRLVAVNARRREVQTESDQLRAERNALSKEVGALMKGGRQAEAEAIKARVREGASRLEVLDAELKTLEADEAALILSLPNLLDPRVPAGRGEEDNVVVATWGEPPALAFTPRSHDEIGAKLDIIDMERAAKLSGARFSVLKGAGARLDRALIAFFLDRAGANGYTEVATPYIVSRTTMTGTGQLPKFEADLFRLAGELNGDQAFLIPTAEVPVTNLHRDEILEEKQLPISYACFTPCFRAEAGSYGRDTRGMLRQHQFHKVEMVKFTTPERGVADHELLTSHAEGLLQALGLPYRKVMLCSADTGAGAAICYDLEVWLPSQGVYREISSCSLFTDFQARRLKLRYRPEGGGKPRLCHTINGSGLAVGRTVVAILENYQQADGSVIVPEVLRPYMGGLDRITAGV